MTMVVALLSPDYAAILADTRIRISGPARFPSLGISMTAEEGRIEIEDGHVVVPLGGRTLIDQPYPGLEKARFSLDGGEAFSFAGNRDGAGPFLGWDGVALGEQADQQIAAYFQEATRFGEVPSLAPGLYDSIGGLHVYRANERFVAARYDASPFHLCRWYTRSGTDEVRAVAIGSGARHLDYWLDHGGFAPLWKDVRRKTGGADFAEIFGVIAGAFHQVSQIESDVNATLRVWIRPRESGTFVDFGGCGVAVPPVRT